MELFRMAMTIEDVRNFAVAKHGDQVREHDGSPYIVHLDNVAGILTEHGHRQPEVIAAALLHDVVEDTATTIQELIEIFGEEVAELVYWLTDDKMNDSQAHALPSAWRLARAPWNAKLIKLADIIDNGVAIVDHDRRFAPMFLEEKRLILKKMVEVERDRLLKLPLFQKAAIVTESASL